MDDLRTTEMVFLDGTIRPGPLLEDEIFGHCLVKHESQVFMIGGWRNGDYTSTVNRFDVTVDKRGVV